MGQSRQRDKAREMKKFLVDTSALYPLILKLKHKVVEIAEILRILDLTLYEVGNVIWKEYKLGRIRDLDGVVSMFSEVLSWIKIDEIELKDLKEIAKLAVNRGVPFYDASYIYIAEKRGYKLVTLDSDVLEKCTCAVTPEQMLRELRVEK